MQISAQGKTRDNIASIAGVSHDTIAKVEKIESEAPAPVISASNGNDEWLPYLCELQDACPHPCGVACWEQYLKYRHCREEMEAKEEQKSYKKIIKSC